MEDLIIWGFALVFFGVSYFVGTHNENKHFADIAAREKASILLPAVTLRKAEDRPVAKTKLVMGSVVIGGDYFKQITAQLASVFGMRIAVAESLIDRARREAVLRMKEQANGADVILNVNILSMKIGDRGENISGLEALAYGTAVYYAK